MCNFFHDFFNDDKKLDLDFISEKLISNYAELFFRKYLFFANNFRLNIPPFYYSPCWCTPRGRLLNKSSSSSSIPAPRWVTVASRPRRTKWPSWDPSRRTLPRPKLQPKIFPKSAFVNIFFKPNRKNKFR